MSSRQYIDPQRSLRANSVNVIETLEPRRLMASTFEHVFPDRLFAQLITADVAVAKSGAIFMTGRFEGTVDIDPSAGERLLDANDSNAFVARFSRGGKLVWVKTFDSGDGDSAVSISVGGGSVGIVGQSVAANDQGRLFVLRYTLDGVRKLRAFSARGFNGEVRGIALDSNANIIFSGFTNTDFTFKGQSIDNTNAFAGFVVKVNKSGEVKWTKTLAEDASINAVAVDSADRVYLTGSFDNESTDFTPGVDGGEIEGASDQNQYAFVARLSKGGTFVWGKSMGASGGFSNTTARGRGIAVDDDGNVAVTGQFSSELVAGDDEIDANSPNDIFIAKLDKDGEFIFAHGFGPDTNIAFDEGSSGTDVAFDSAGRIIVVGTYQDVVDFDPGSDTKNKNSGGIRGFILKLTKAGNFFAFAQARGGTTSGFSGVDIGEEDTVVAVGFFFNNDEGLLMKLTKRLKR